MAQAHRGYLAYPIFRRHRRRWSSRPIVWRSSNRISMTAAAAMPAAVAMYIVDLFLLRSTVLLRHQGQRDRCAHDDRVQSAPVACPSRLGCPPVKLVMTRHSASRCSTHKFGRQRSLLLSFFQFFSSCLTYQFTTSRGWINIAPLDPLVFIHTLFLAQNYYSAFMHTRIYTTNPVTGFLFLRSYHSCYHKHVHNVQVSQFHFFASDHCALVRFFPPVLMTIRQSKPYTVTFFYSTVWCIANFLQYCSTVFFLRLRLHLSLAFGKQNGDDIIRCMYLRGRTSGLDIVIIPKE